ncbi:MAG: hypothetical protein ABJ004_04425 [Cyclobacteriaceae bacterium]
MESRIKELQEKYWAGETTLAEEAELKAYFKSNPSLTAQGRYFQAVNTKAKKPGVTFKHPRRAGWKSRWSVAAAVLVGIMTAAIVIQDSRSGDNFLVEDPKEAYEITRKALMMVSSGLNEGKTYSKEIGHINKAEQIISDEE